MLFRSFFCSHLLYEIEPVADQIAILNKGRIVLEAPADALRRDVRQFVLSLQDYERVKPVGGLLDARVSGRQAALISSDANRVRQVLREAGVPAREVELNLDEIFEAYVIGKAEDGSREQ